MDAQAMHFLDPRGDLRRRRDQDIGLRCELAARLARECDDTAAARAAVTAASTFGELPLVLIANNRSPACASASTWRAKTA